MILSGDIGGTKTSIGLFRMEKDALKEEYSDTFATRDYSGLQTLIKDNRMAEFHRAKNATMHFRRGCGRFFLLRA
ncbi:MAG: glucokinase [Gammaproteobacteria bacterium]